MITRRQIRVRVMQALYAYQLSGDGIAECYDNNLKEFSEEIRENEKKKGETGDVKLLSSLYHDCIENKEKYDKLIQSRAENWELERIALLDLILMKLGISEMLHFEEIPIKVTINEYLEIAKEYSTPQSSKFINGILDNLYAGFKKDGQIKKKGRGLIEESIKKSKEEE